MQEVDAGFCKKFNLNPRFELSTGLHYSLKNIDAPGDARLPTSLHRVAVNMEFRINDKPLSLSSLCHGNTVSII